MNAPDRFPVACPRDWCCAKVGEPCRSSGGAYTSAHIGRRQAAAAINKRVEDLSVVERAELNRRPR